MSKKCFSLGERFSYHDKRVVNPYSFRLSPDDPKVAYSDGFRAAFTNDVSYRNQSRDYWRLKGTGCYRAYRLGEIRAEKLHKGRK